MARNLQPGAERRRSARIELRIPIRVKGKDASGKDVDVPAEAEQVSLHGVRIRASSEFRPGVEVELANAETRQSSLYRVVWAREKPEQRRWLLGLELSAGQSSLWGVGLAAESAKDS
ncbi:MAG: PilZ domain-containing protein [Terriglobia bacterium]